MSLHIFVFRSENVFVGSMTVASLLLHSVNLTLLIEKCRELHLLKVAVIIMWSCLTLLMFSNQEL